MKQEKKGKRWHALIWRSADIISGTPIGITITSRSKDFLLEPEMAVDRKKIQRIVAAADAYVRLFNLDAPVRFDIITLVKDAEGYHIREHIEDAFYAPGY